MKINFNNQKLKQRLYIIMEIVPTTEQTEFIKKKVFKAITLNPDNTIFIVDIRSLTSSNSIHLSCKAQILLLKTDKAYSAIPTEYTNLVNVFSLVLTIELPKYTRINNHNIKLLNSKQLSYGPIYSLEPMKLEILKTCIKTNLAKSFKRPFKSYVDTLILFIWKINSSFCF